MIKYFDIFAGIGGFRSGLEKAGGFECVGYCEIDRYAKKAYETMVLSISLDTFYSNKNYAARKI
ncbi:MULTISPECIES: DNA cytosine methyltransferase [Ruminococcus]|uniref:DNA cytosine methyltransferase n=2 Tax=Oscillospiraceae TaxID=216572 RepID=UPI00399052FD